MRPTHLTAALIVLPLLVGAPVASASETTGSEGWAAATVQEVGFKGHHGFGHRGFGHRGFGQRGFRRGFGHRGFGHRGFGARKGVVITDRGHKSKAVIGKPGHKRDASVFFGFGFF